MNALIMHRGLLGLLALAVGTLGHVSSALADWQIAGPGLITATGDAPNGFTSLGFDCRTAVTAKFFPDDNIVPRPVAESGAKILIESGTDAPSEFTAQVDGSYALTGEAARAVIVMALAQKELSVQVDLDGERFYRTVFSIAGIDGVVSSLAQCLEPHSGDASAVPTPEGLNGTNATPALDDSPVPGENDGWNPLPTGLEPLQGEWTDNKVDDLVHWAIIARGDTHVEFTCNGKLSLYSLELSLRVRTADPALKSAYNDANAFIVVRVDGSSHIRYAPAYISVDGRELSISAGGQSAHDLAKVIEKAKSQVEISAALTDPSDGKPLLGTTSFSANRSKAAIEAAIKGCRMGG